MLSSNELAGLIEGLAGLPYGGEAADQRRHALQCAGHAVAAGSYDELVLAAALQPSTLIYPFKSVIPPRGQREEFIIGLVLATHKTNPNKNLFVLG
jgi:hypothetical protein